MFRHHLRLEHDRQPTASTFATPDSNSTIDITATSGDLIEAWRELLSRLPNDVYAALKAAIGDHEGPGRP